MEVPFRVMKTSSRFLKKNQNLWCFLFLVWR